MALVFSIENELEALEFEAGPADAGETVFFLDILRGLRRKACELFIKLCFVALGGEEVAIVDDFLPVVEQDSEVEKVEEGELNEQEGDDDLNDWFEVDIAHVFLVGELLFFDGEFSGRSLACPLILDLLDCEGRPFLFFLTALVMPPHHFLHVYDQRLIVFNQHRLFLYR